MTATDPSAPPSVSRRRKKFRLTRSDKVIATVLFFGLVALLLIPFIFFAIRPGEVGVLYRLFGGGTETVFVHTEGIGVKLPWNTIYRYEVRSQARDETVNALAADGLSVTVELTVLYHPIPHDVGLLHKTVGPDYAERLVRPVTIEAIRAVVGKYSPHDLYREDIASLEAEVLGLLKLSSINLIDYRDIIIRRLTLPESLNDAITRKLTEEQHAHAYDYLIQQAEKEAERKRVEAIGIQTFYSIVADALSPQLLTWRGIEATVQLARSPNSKVVIVGGGKDQMPLILGSDISSQPVLPAPEAVNPNSNTLPNFDELPRLFPENRTVPVDRPLNHSSSNDASNSETSSRKTSNAQDASGGTGPVPENKATQTQEVTR